MENKESDSLRRNRPKDMVQKRGMINVNKLFRGSSFIQSTHLE